MSHKFSNNAKSLLTDWPHLSRWVNECKFCRRIGYKPETPTTNENLKAHGITSPTERLRNNYEMLGLDEDGICEDCRTLIDP